METPHTDFWRHFVAPSPDPPAWRDFYLAPMPDGSRLLLPLRDLGETAVAGLIANQATFDVVDRLTLWMAERVRRFDIDLVVGLPTLGHVVASGVARALRHPHWVAAGYSRKLWYNEKLSVPVASVTSPQAGRRMWLDPRMLPRLRGHHRVLLADDVICTGASMRAGLALLRAAGVVPAAVCVAMIQGNQWQVGWDASIQVTGAFATPLFARTGGGWVARPETALHHLCEVP